MNRTKYAVVFLLIGVCCADRSSAVDAEPASNSLDVGDRVCLFLDDCFFVEQAGLERHWHQAQPREEVAIREDVGKGKWERWPHMFGSTLYDPQAKVYRMYYESAVYPSRTPPNSFTTYVCYAESKDGKAWTKPMVGLFEDLGSKQNNIVVHCAEFPKVFVDPLEKDPESRLKMFVYLNGKPPLMGGTGECVLGSGDGIRWKFLGGYQMPQYANQEQAAFTDTFCFMFDPRKERYMAFIRTFEKNQYSEAKHGRRRAVGISESKQVIKGWSPIVQVLAPDAQDDAKVAKLSKDPNKPDWAEHYCMPLCNYGNHYLGMLSLLYFVDGVDSNGGGDLQLTFSHDGQSWHRQPERQTMIAPSNAAPALFPTYVAINGPLEIDGALWIYYTEANGAHPISPFDASIAQIRAATWRKDGFASLDADAAGSFTTHPLKFTGNRLAINAALRVGGKLRVGILAADGKPIPGFAATDCDPIVGDQTTATVTWGGKGDLATITQPVRLRVELSHGQVYSFRFSR